MPAQHILGDAEEYRSDAAYYFQRAAELIRYDMTAGHIEDATLQFSFGVERCFKSILAAVNPLFVLESHGFDNASGVFYRYELQGKHKEAADKTAAKADGFNSSVLPFKASMLRAAKFSDEIEGRIGQFTKLSDYRGIIAHRPLRMLPYDEVKDFLGRVFWPTVEVLSAVLQLDLNVIAGERGDELKALSERRMREEQFAQDFEDKLREHREIWESRQADDALIQIAAKATKEEIEHHPWSDSSSQLHTCPACDKDAVLRVEADYDGSPGDWYLSGIYVGGLHCHYCDLEIDDQEEVDYLKLNEVVFGH